MSEPDRKRLQDQKKKDRLPYIMIFFSSVLIFSTVVVYLYVDSLEDEEAPVLTGIDIILSDGTSISVYSESFEEIVSQDIVDKCARYLQVSKMLLDANNGTANIGEWSEQDRSIVLQIEELYNTECVLDSSNAMVNLESCTETYITIQQLIDNMVDRNRGTLSEEDEEQYKQSYLDYFNYYCNTVYDDIIQQPSFMAFNSTR